MKVAVEQALQHSLIPLFWDTLYHIHILDIRRILSSLIQTRTQSFQYQLDFDTFKEHSWSLKLNRDLQTNWDNILTILDFTG